MNFRGQNIDMISFWSQYVDFPPNMDESAHYLPLVRCPNPAHDTLKKHFQINNYEPLVHCFANCGISGSVEHAIATIEGLYDRHDKRRAYREARKLVFRTARDPDSRDGIQRGHRDHLRPRPQAHERPALDEDTLARFSYLPPVALDYLEKRRISGASIARWELGWDPDTKRITIPVRDERGRLKFLIRRAISAKQSPKYLYDEGAQRADVLYGACIIDQGLVRSDGIVLVEGSIDTIALHQAGVSNAVGVLGSHLSKRQAEVISRLRPAKVVCWFDLDSSGVAAVFSVRKRISSIPLRVCRYKAGASDPAEAVFRAQEVQDTIANAISFLQFKTRVRQLLGGIPQRWQTE